MKGPKQPDSLNKITLVSAHIKDNKHFAFVGQRFLSDDSWQHVPTYIIFYLGNEPTEKRWLVHELDFDTWANEVQGVWCDNPKGAWLFGYRSTGELLLFNQQGQPIYTETIPKRPYKNTVIDPHFLSVNTIEGKAYTARGARTIWKRENKGQWLLLDQGIPELDYYNKDRKKRVSTSEHGFRVIDGFAENDLYACGGRGDLWHYDGQQWRQKELPTNASLHAICCGGGQVYITTNMRTIVVGRGDRWQVIEQDLTSSTFEQAVWYRDRCYINTASLLYEIFEGEFIKSPLQEGMPNLPSHIDVRGDIFLAASLATNAENEISYYDGQEWQVLIAADLPAHDPNAPSSEEVLKKIRERRAKRKQASEE